jgi:hypothetical protein
VDRQLALGKGGPHGRLELLGGIGQEPIGQDLAAAFLQLALQPLALVPDILSCGSQVDAKPRNVRLRCGLPLLLLAHLAQEDGHVANQVVQLGPVAEPNVGIGMEMELPRFTRLRVWPVELISEQRLHRLGVPITGNRCLLNLEHSMARTELKLLARGDRLLEVPQFPLAGLRFDIPG